MEEVKEKNIKIKMIIAGTLMVLLLLLVFFVHRSNSMTQNEILQVMNKANDYTNFSMIVTKTQENAKEEKEVKVFKNKKLERNETMLMWTDYEAGEEITISEIEKTAVIEKIEKQEYQFFVPSNYKRYQYKYLGEKQIEDKMYSLIAYKSNDYYVEVELDMELGINIKEELYNLEQKMRKGTLNKVIEISKFKPDCVTAEELARPDLTGYKVVDKR